MYNIYADTVKEMNTHIEKGDLITALALMAAACYFFKHVNGVEELDEDIHNFVAEITGNVKDTAEERKRILDYANALLRRFYELGSMLVRATPIIPKDHPDRKTLS